MASENQLNPPAASSMSSVPRAVWIGGGVLGLVTAALAGALVMRTADEPARPVALATPTSGSSGAGSPTFPTDPAPPDGTPVPLTTAATATASAAAPSKPRPAATAPAATRAVAAAHSQVCKTCGVVESVTEAREKGDGTGVGAVAGGVLGGVVGHQVGGGRGNTAMTVLGAVGGVLAGNEVEKRARSTTYYDIHVHMADGSDRVFRRDQALAVGTHVVDEGSTLRLAQ